MAPMFFEVQSRRTRLELLRRECAFLREMASDKAVPQLRRESAKRRRFVLVREIRELIDELDTRVHSARTQSTP
jgi:hypothetical protein